MKMGCCAHGSSSLFLYLILCSRCATAFDPADSYLISCGSRVSMWVNRRLFAADDTPRRGILSAPGYVFAATTLTQISFASGDLVRLYQTAVIFPQAAKYAFPIRRRGRHWIRFYFFPSLYGAYDTGFASFSVWAQNHLLISNFTHNDTYSFTEYSLNVTSDSLVLAFVPSSPLHFAFLNALEVISAPDELFASAKSIVRAPSLAGAPRGLSTQALQTVVRVNIGGLTIYGFKDALERQWIADQSFLVRRVGLAVNVSNQTAVRFAAGGPKEIIAPASLYGTATVLNGTKNYNAADNPYLQWEFGVDPGFQYLVRYHFCAIANETRNKIFLDAYIDSWLVSPDLDLGAVTSGVFGEPYYFDALTDIVWSNKLRISISPSPAHADAFAILNGLEIMKLNDSSGALSNEFPEAGRRKLAKVGLIVGIGLIVIVCVLSVLARICCGTCGRRRHSHWKAKYFIMPSDKDKKHSSSSARSFPFVEVEESTNNFDENWVIGVGGFGKVYRGVLRDGTEVAVKRSGPGSQQGLPEFRNEIELLSQFRHRHLVSLIGYCDENDEMILVYEFMDNGTLKSHLYGFGFPSLSWEKRLEICIGAASGIHYLHTGCETPVIHRDVKSANILLDKHFVARVADFGLSRAMPEIDQTHVSTAVKGTFGYLDPEYFRRRRLTTKSDVYSFGVVLLEVLCAQPVLDASLTGDMDDLVQRAVRRRKSEKWEQILDPNLARKIRPDSLQKFAETAEKCLAERSIDRPSMEEVLHNLGHALRLQEGAVELRGDPGEKPRIVNAQVGEASLQFNRVEMKSKFRLCCTV